jgi:hypothetical protein
MLEMVRAEQVMRDRALPPPPASLARGESWPVAWHELRGFAAVLLVQRSPYFSRWRRPRFDLLVAELVSEEGGPFICDSVGGSGPGLRYDPFAPSPRLSNGTIDGETATRVETDESGEPVSQHALGWGRAGAGVTFVELRTDVESVRVPAISAGGYFIAVATGQDPSLVVHAATDDAEATP